MIVNTHLEFVQGDDRKARDGRALTWSSPTWPNVASATLTMIVGHDSQDIYGNVPQTWTGAVPSSPPSPSTVSLDVTSAQTVALPGGQYDYTLTATLTNGDKVTLAAGQLSVIPTPNSPIPPQA